MGLTATTARRPVSGSGAAAGAASATGLPSFRLSSAQSGRLCCSSCSGERPCPPGLHAQPRLVFHDLGLGCTSTCRGLWCRIMGPASVRFVDLYPAPHTGQWQIRA